MKNIAEKNHRKIFEKESILTFSILLLLCLLAHFLVYMTQHIWNVLFFWQRDTLHIWFSTSCFFNGFIFNSTLIVLLNGLLNELLMKSLGFDAYNEIVQLKLAFFNHFIPLWRIFLDCLQCSFLVLVFCEHLCVYMLLKSKMSSSFVKVNISRLKLLNYIHGVVLLVSPLFN